MPPKTPTAESVAFVRDVLGSVPPARDILKRDPASFDGPTLLKVLCLTRAMQRDAVIRTASLPDAPEWVLLSQEADDVVKLDLVTVPAVAAWLDGIEDAPTVHAYISLSGGLCRPHR